MKGGGFGDGTPDPAEMSETELPEIPAAALAQPGPAGSETAPEITPDTTPAQQAEAVWRPGLRSRLWAAVTLPRVLLVLIAAGAATGYAWSLNTSGLETYYAAGVRSMSESWHAFFYDAFDPHATITLDKLPGAFWIQALSVRCFGYSVWAIVLPQVVESTLTVLVLYRAVRRTAGTAAALTAAALLAASPITLASTRGDLAEPLYLLCIVLAADAALRAVTTGRRRSWYAAGAWVAAGFQAKMTEAWLVLPILALVMVLTATQGRRRVA
ncbi:glycosyltransferase family 39 protein, partial [Actinospica durhamensis]